MPESGAGAARGRGRDVPPSPSPRFPFPAVPVHACGSLIPSEIREIFGAVCRPRAPSSPTPAKQFPIIQTISQDFKIQRIQIKDKDRPEERPRHKQYWWSR